VSVRGILPIRGTLAKLAPRARSTIVHAMARLPRIADIDGSAAGDGFFLCARKERRTGRNGAPFLVLLLQDASGEIDAKVFQDVELVDPQFDAGEFVAVQGRGQLYNRRLELVLDRVRRVIPDDTRLGFREEDCVPCSPRPLAEMWAELGARLDSVSDPHIRSLLWRLVHTHGDRLQVWPAARQIHHAYRGGLLEHILKIMEMVVALADGYALRRDLLIAGALLHDIGKLRELDYGGTIDYSVEGNLLGHIAIGAAILRDAVRETPGFPAALALELEHLILSHHGQKELGSPVTPMTAEAIALAAADDLDAKMHQVRRHLAGDRSEGPFTAYHRHLERVLLKPSG
jgi:3'-5' exoribonuclease